MIQVDSFFLGFRVKGSYTGSGMVLGLGAPGTLNP